jgi:hypothetical protein
VVCGSALLQSVAAIACCKGGYVGVFVPSEDTPEQTVSNIGITQRACEASIVLVDVGFWEELASPSAYRCDFARVLWEPYSSCTVFFRSPLSA